MRRLARAFCADERGAAALELGLIAPLIALIGWVSFGIWRIGGENQDARAGLETAAEYYMNGGLNDAAAQSVAVGAWRNRPVNGTVTTARSYRCGASAADMNTVCPGGRTPAVYVTLLAAGSRNQHQISMQRVIRVR